MADAMAPMALTRETWINSDRSNEIRCRFVERSISSASLETATRSGVDQAFGSPRVVCRQASKDLRGVSRPVSGSMATDLSGLPAHSTVATESAEEKPNGNNVDLEEQVLTMGQIQSDYQQAASLYRRSVGLLKIAIGR